MRFELSLLRLVSFRRVLLARVSSLLGTNAAPIALAFAVLDLPGNPTANLGTVLLGRSLTQIVFLLYGGVLADRLPRHRLMVTAEVTAGLSQAAAAALVLAGTAGVLSLTALSVVNGAASALFLPATSGIMPQLVPRERLQAANALSGMGGNAATVFGASLAGIAVAAAGPGWALAGDALSFFVSAALLAGVRLAPVDRPVRRSLVSDLVHGWREFVTRSWVWVVVAQFAVLNACGNGVFRTLGPVVSAQRLGGAPAWAAIVAFGSVGWLAGSVVAVRFRPGRPIVAVVLLTLVFPSTIFLLAAGAPLVVVAASALVRGACSTLAGVLWETSLQTHVPLESLSRLSSYDQLGSLVLGPVALAVVGPVSGELGAGPTLWATGALMLAVSAAGLLARQVWKLPATPAPISSAAER